MHKWGTHGEGPRLICPHCPGNGRQLKTPTSLQVQLLLRFRKAGRVSCSGVRETH